MANQTSFFQKEDLFTRSNESKMEYATPLATMDETLFVREENFTPFPWLAFDETNVPTDDIADFGVREDITFLPARSETPLPYERVTPNHEEVVATEPAKGIIFIEDSFQMDLTLDYLTASPTLSPALETQHFNAFAVFEDLKANAFANEPLQNFDAQSDFNFVFWQDASNSWDNAQSFHDLKQETLTDFHAFKVENANFGEIYFPF